MPYVATKDGKPIVINGVVATNCECCSCYYLSPGGCCDGAVGPVRYRIYGSIPLLDTFATSGLPLKIAFPVLPNCWIVSTSTTCDEGELIEWNDATELGGACPDPNPDNCPVICDGVCYSLSATVTITITCTLNLSDATTQAISITKTADMFLQSGSFRCDENITTSAGQPGVSFNGCDLITSYFHQILPGPTRNVNISFAGSTPTLVDNLWDSGTGVTVSSVTGASVTYTFASANNWTLVDGVCVLEVAP